MKKLILIGCLSYMNLALADCDADMMEGHQQAGSANHASAVAAASLSHFKQLIQANAPNEEICNAGQSTRMDTYLTGIRYKHARKAFLSAINTCGAPYDSEAASNADSMTKAYNDSLALMIRYDSSLVPQCGVIATAPVLSNAP